MSLKPIKGRKVKIERIWVGDIEAENWVQFFRLGGYYNGEEYFLFDKLDDFVEFALSKEKLNPIFYFHNLTFDGVFILEHLIKKNYYFKIVKNGALTYEIRARKKVDGKNWVYFRDSYVLLRTSLNEASKIFLGEEKFEFDYAGDFDNKEKLEEYLKRDLYLLYNVLIKFFSAVDFINSISLSSLSLNMFRRGLKDEIYYKINNRLDEYGRQFYYGARVEIFRFFGEDINCYDVNSMYPFVMREYEYPFGRCYFVNKRNIRRLGFYKVRLKDYYIDYITLIFTRTSKLYFVSNDTDDNLYFLNSYELDELDIEGIRYEVIEGVEFTNKGFIFRDYIDELYSKRMQAKQRGDKVMNFVFKLMLNSLYGKFGQSRVKKTYITAEQVDLMYSKILKISDIDKRFEELAKLKKSLVYLGNNVYSYEFSVNFADYLNVYFSAMITSLARLHLFRLLKRYQDYIYYCDTDSIYVNCEVSKNLISDYELGKLKLEKRLKKAIFLLPKFYVYIDIDGKEGSVAKGFKRKVSYSEVENFLSYGDVIYDEYIEPATFLEAMRDYRYLTAKFSITRALKRVIRYVRSRYDKRKVIGENETIPVFYSELKDKII